MSTLEAFKNDWDQDDDKWDDWNDAEDFSTKEEEKTQEKTEQITENSLITNTNNRNNNNPQCNKAAFDIKDAISNKPVDEDQVYREQQVNRRVDKSTENANNWGIWGVLSKASEGLGSITTSVSQGLNQVIGVPGPEEMARLNAAEANRIRQNNASNNDYDNNDSTEQEEAAAASAFGLSLVSGVTSLGSKVLNTGLDTLEGIGKKTMNILQENDPLLMNKRKMLGLEPNKPNLSEILNEARKDADQLENTLKELKLEKSKDSFRFDILFENYCGLVHLEALEILSNESKLKLQTLLDSVSGIALTELQETTNEVKELMELEELDSECNSDYGTAEFREQLGAAIEDVGLQINFEDLVSNFSRTLDWLATVSTIDEQDIFAKGITVLAETCALEVNKLHKIGELLLVKEHHSTANEVDSVVQLCKQFTLHLNGQTTRFAVALTAKETESAKAYISTLFAEMLVATQHIEKAFRLFLPILQLGAV